MSSKRFTLSTVPTFKDLPAEALRRLEERLQPIHVRRGDHVVRQGDAADALYIVVSGRFAVEVDGHSGVTVAEISRGSTIGEIAFFAGGNRTATVTAIRDGIVVRLTRTDFDAISENSAAVWAGITATLAERLAAATRRSSVLSNSAQVRHARPRPRTIAIVGATSGYIPQTFMTAFAKAAAARSGTLIASSETIAGVVSYPCASDLEFTEALNSLESRYSTIAFIADPRLALEREIHSPGGRGAARGLPAG